MKTKSKVDWHFYLLSDKDHDGGSFKFAVNQDVIVLGGEAFPDGIPIIHSGTDMVSQLLVSRNGAEVPKGQDEKSFMFQQPRQGKPKDVLDSDYDSGNKYYHYRWRSPHILKSPEDGYEVNLLSNASLAVVINLKQKTGAIIGQGHVDGVPVFQFFTDDADVISTPTPILVIDRTTTLIIIVVFLVLIINAALLTFIWYWRRKKKRQREERKREKKDLEENGGEERDKKSGGKKTDKTATTGGSGKKVPPLKFASTTG